MVDMMTDAARHNIRIGSFTPNILDLYEKVDRQVPIGDKRWVIEHVGVLSPDEIARIRDLGIVLTVYSGRYIYQEGAMLAHELGGDAGYIADPVAARCRGAGFPGDRQCPAVAVPLGLACNRAHRRGNRRGDLTGRMRHPGRSAGLRQPRRGLPDVRGSGQRHLEEGKFADIAVLSDDPFTIDEARIPDIAADRVWSAANRLRGGREFFGVDLRGEAPRR